MRWFTQAVLLLMGVALAACQAAGPAPGATRPGSLTIGIGGSVGMAGAAVTQPRATPRN
jgi:hypothetical protein